MVKRVVLALVAIAAVAVWLTFEEEGRSAFGGIFEPVESVRADAGGLDRMADPGGAMGAGGSFQAGGQDYGPMLDRLRSSLDDAMEESGRRSSVR